MRVDRRNFLGMASMAAAGAISETIAAPAWGQDVRGLPLTPIVQTSAGKLRGVNRDGVEQFWGVPYAASTGSENRFMPPTKVASWTGVRDCFLVGNRAPQGLAGPISEILALDRHEPTSEDCLNLNLFTPGLGRGNRPVMVWLHGGGFFGGSGNWLLYDGTNLAHKEDVVVVSVTHRLNLFGFLHLADLGGGEKWANSSNLGMQDIVAALNWIKDNISAFGANPGNVTVFGHSGGGNKVTTLMAMPSAKGLIHRAISMSAPQIYGTPRENATRAAEQFLSKLGIRSNELDRLQQFSWRVLQDAFFSEPRIQGLGDGPVVDGHFLPRDPWHPEAPTASTDVPLMTGSSETEGAFSDPAPLQMSEGEMLSRVRKMVINDDARARELVALYQKTHAGISNADVWLTMNADNTFRANAQLLSELKASQGKAPSYLYYFAWRSSVRNGQLKAYHGLDIPFALYNVDLAASMTGASQERYALAHNMSAAFARFARTGNPNHRDLPNWPVFDSRTYPTMVFANDCKVLNDPNREERLALNAIRRVADGKTPAAQLSDRGSVSQHL